MAEDTTKLVIQVETLLKGLDKTLRGLGQIETQLKRVSSIKVGGASTTTGFDRATAAARRLELQQQRLSIQTQNLANRQERADQATQRLALGQQRLAAAQERVTRNAGQQADAHVKAFQDIERGSKQANQAIIGLGNSLRSVGQGLTSIGATLSVTLTAPIVALGTASTAAAVKMDSLRRGLTAIVGSSTEAGRQLGRLTELAKLPGIGFEEAIQGSIRLQAVGFSARDAEKALKEFANAVALTGGGREELSRITVQLGQLAAKGKVLSQDLRPIIEAAPAVGRALKEAFGTVNADDIAKLTDSSQEFLEILVGQLEKLPRASAGAKNALENFSDTVFRAAAAIGESLLPTLTKLIDILGPVLTGIAQGFRDLPAPFRTTLVIVGALVAALGPVVFIVGQLTTGIGRIIVGLAQLNALGLLPTIKNMRLFAAGTLAAAEAEGTLAAASVATGAAIAGLAAILGTIVIAYIAWRSAQSDSVDVTQEQLDAINAQVDGLKEQEKFLNSLQKGVKRTADEQDNLREVYNSLNLEAQSRVAGISDEEKRTAALRDEVQKLLQLRLQEREQSLAQIAGQLANTAATIQSNEQEIASITARIAANNELAKSLQESGRISDEGSRQLARGVETTKSAATAAQVLQRETLALTQQQNALRTSTDESQKKAQELAEKLRALGITSKDQIRQFLILSQLMGSFSGSIDEVVPVLEKMIADLDKGADAARRFKNEFSGMDQALRDASDSSEQLSKDRQELIRRNAILAKEFGRNAAEARQAFDEFIRRQPELRAAIEREAQISGVSIEEIITKALGTAGKDRGEALRNAQEQLNDALDKVQQAATEKTIEREKSKTERLLGINELRFRRELQSFRQFAIERARLEREEIQGEIDRQKKIAALATEDIKRAQERAGTTTGVEQVKARTDEQVALARKTQAETKILDLQSKQRGVLFGTIQDLDQFTRDREQRFRELNREIDQIIGKEGEAERAAISERFAEDLRTLRNEIKAAGIDLVRAFAEGDKAGGRLAAATLDQLRGQVQTIENTKKQLNALVEVREANEEIRRAEEAQQNLEHDLAVGVEFRGLKEEDAIKKRLEGEAKVREVIQQQQIRLEILAQTLKKAGVEIPIQLAEAIERLKVQSEGLGELPFVEQFRLAQKEFDRLNDERIQKIQEVERAVAHRDISELQGRIAIKAANGEYVGALEKQLELLRKIAAESGDAGLKRQAEDARNTTEEVKNATTEVANLNDELQSAAIDSAHDAFAGIGRSLLDIAKHATTAKEAVLDMLNRIAERLVDITFDRLADQIFGGLLGGATKAATGGIGGTVASAAGQGTSGTAAAAALQTGAATASAELVTGGATAAASITAAGAGFFAAVSAAGIAFATAVTAASATQAVGSAGSSLAGAIGAATGMFPAAPGGLIHVVEGGHPEAILTTDPKHAARQASILREYLQKTQGLWGRIPKFEAGGWASPSQMESNLLNSLGRSRGFSAPTPSADMRLNSPSLNVRNINLIDRGQLVSGHLRSAEGARDILNVISTERDEVGRRIGIK